MIRSSIPGVSLLTMLLLSSPAQAREGSDAAAIDQTSPWTSALTSTAGDFSLEDAQQVHDLLTPAEAAALATFSPLPMQAATSSPDFDKTAASGGDSPLVFVMNFAIWAPGIAGTTGVGRFDTRVNASFIDILEDTDSVLGFTGMMRVYKGKWGAYLGGSWNKMGANVGPRARTDVTSTVGICSFGLSYELGHWAMGWTAAEGEPARDLTVLLTAGGRYYGLDLDVDFDVLPDLHKSKSWVDPMVGGAFQLPISRKFSIVGSGEVGGFGVASDFAWTASLLLSYDFHIGRFPSSLQAGYLAVGDNYSSGSGRSRFEWDTIMHGVLLNFSMKF